MGSRFMDGQAYLVGSDDGVTSKRTRRHSLWSTAALGGSSLVDQPGPLSS